MARTIKVIFDEMVAEKENQLDLAGLTSASKVARWRVLFYVFAVAIHVHEVILDVYQERLQVIADSAIVGSAPWYQSMILKYQHGDLLVYDTQLNRFSYDQIDTTKMVVDRCAIVDEENGTLTIKVAKEENGGLVPLTEAEQLGLVSYIKKVRFAGVAFTLFSGNGDLLRVFATVYYDPQIPIQTVKEAIEASVVAHVSNLPFNGRLQSSTLVDKMQAVQGVSDVVLASLQTRPSTNVPWQTVNRTYVAQFGYFRFSEPDDLATTINYVAV